MIAIEEIKHHPAWSKTDQIFETVNGLINGRIPHSNMAVLYVLREMMKNDCGVYLEIGVHNGGSMAVAMQSEYPCKFYGIDMFEKVLQNPRWSYFRTDELSYWKAFHNIRRCNSHNHEFEIIDGDSRAKSTIGAAFKIQDVGLFFIDGDHTYPVVKSDFDNYSRLVKPGGIVVFDDYNPDGHPDIVRFVNELDDPKWRKIGQTTNEFMIQRNDD